MAMVITRTSDGLYRPDLTKSGTVYGPDAAGRYTEVLRSNLPCTLIRLARRGAESGAERVELSSLRELHWDSAYVMPEHDGAEVEIDGVRWHPETGTFDAMEGPTGEVFYRLADVRRV
jgi:hypothetical protein